MARIEGTLYAEHDVAEDRDRRSENSGPGARGTRPPSSLAAPSDLHSTTQPISVVKRGPPLAIETAKCTGRRTLPNGGVAPAATIMEVFRPARSLLALTAGPAPSSR